MTTQPHKFITQEAAAELIGCSVKTIRRRIDDGVLPGYRFGKRAIRIDVDDLPVLMEPVRMTNEGKRP